MCGIAGILIGKAKQNDLEQLRALFTANLIANEERGKEATGALVVQSDGSWFLEKAPLDASTFTKTSKYLNLIKKIDNNTTCILGHTRRPTKGSPEDNNNNHPIVFGETIGVHNGTLSNDDEIFLTHVKAGEKSRIGAVDSEAIFALIDEVPRNNGLNKQCLKLSEMSRLLQGSYTSIYIHPNEPSRVYLLKYNNPMSVHYSPQYEALFFSSRYVFLRKAFGRAVITEALPSRYGYVFEAKKIQESGKTPLCAFPLAEQSGMFSCQPA